MDEFKLNQGITNGVKLLLLIFNGGTRALELIKDKIEKERNPAGSQLDVGYLENLGVYLTQPEKERVRSGQWDIQLLHRYLLKVLHSNDESTPKQNESDQSLLADIKRINHYRNLMCHKPAIDLSEQQFEKYWNDCAAAIHRLGISEQYIKKVRNLKQFYTNEEIKEEESGTELKELLKKVKGDGNITKELWSLLSCLSQHCYSLDKTVKEMRHEPPLENLQVEKDHISSVKKRLTSFPDVKKDDDIVDSVDMDRKDPVDPTYEDYPFNISQSSAIISNGSTSADGTNGCAFFCVLIADHIIQYMKSDEPNRRDWENLRTKAQDIISKSPESFNRCRDKERYYDSFEAYDILKENEMILEYEMQDLLLGQYAALSDEGKQQLSQKLSELMKASSDSRTVKVAMYTCGGYMFLIGSTSSRQLFVVDTHSIPSHLGGLGGGLLKVFHAADDDQQVNQLCFWVRSRLESSGIPNTEPHCLSSMVPPDKTASGSGSNINEVNSEDGNEGTTASEHSMPPADESFPTGEEDSLVSLKDIKTAKKHFFGEGGQGIIYKATVDYQGRPSECVIKVFRKEGKAFSRERKVKNLRHPHILPLLGLFSNANISICDEVYHRVTVYPFMPGGDLRKRLFARSSEMKELPWKRRLKIAFQILRGLQYLHSRKLILRDVKLSNILLDENDNVRICDYGLVKEFDNECSTSTTWTREVQPSQYIHPEYERERKKKGKNVKAKPVYDQYSFAIVLLELLTEIPAVDESRSCLPDRLGFDSFVSIESTGNVDSLVSQSCGAILNNENAKKNMDRIGWPDTVRRTLAELCVRSLFEKSSKAMPIEKLNDELQRLVQDYPETEIDTSNKNKCENTCVAKITNGKLKDTQACYKCIRRLELYKHGGDYCIYCCLGKKECQLNCWCKLACQDCEQRFLWLQCPFHVEKVLHIDEQCTRLLVIPGGFSKETGRAAFVKDAMDAVDCFDRYVGIGNKPLGLELVNDKVEGRLEFIMDALDQFKKEFAMYRSKSKKTAMVVLLSGHCTDDGQFLLQEGQPLLSGTKLLEKLIEVGADVTVVIAFGCYVERFFENYEESRKKFFSKVPQKPTGPSQVDAFERNVVVCFSGNREKVAYYYDPKGDSYARNTMYVRYLLNGIEGATQCYRPAAKGSFLEKSEEPCTICTGLREDRAGQDESDFLDVLEYVHRHIERDRKDFPNLPLPGIKIKFIEAVNNSGFILPIKHRPPK